MYNHTVKAILRWLLTLGEDKLRYVVARALFKIPADVVELVVEGCLFFMPTIEGKSTYLPLSVIRGKPIIGVPESLLDEPEEVVDRTIIHEVAHFVLKHKDPAVDGLTTEEYEEQERRADSLVDQWLQQSDEA